MLLHHQPLWFLALFAFCFCVFFAFLLGPLLVSHSFIVLIRPEAGLWPNRDDSSVCWALQWHSSVSCHKYDPSPPCHISLFADSQQTVHLGRRQPLGCAAGEAGRTPKFWPATVVCAGLAHYSRGALRKEHRAAWINSAARNPWHYFFCCNSLFINMYVNTYIHICMHTHICMAIL